MDARRIYILGVDIVNGAVMVIILTIMIPSIKKHSGSGHSQGSRVTSMDSARYLGDIWSLIVFSVKVAATGTSTAQVGRAFTVLLNVQVGLGETYLLYIFLRSSTRRAMDPLPSIGKKTMFSSG